MARGVNKVILVGNLGADPETRAMPSGSYGRQSAHRHQRELARQESGEQQERTEWHRVALFGRLAEIAGEYLKKGSQVYIEGSLRTRKWQDKQGNERYSTEIVGNEMQMLGGRGGGAGGAGGGGGGGGSGAVPAAAAVAAVAAEPVVVAVAARPRIPIPSTPALRARAARRTISTTIFRSDGPERGLGRIASRGVGWAASH